MNPRRFFEPLRRRGLALVVVGLLHALAILTLATAGQRIAMEKTTGAPLVVRFFAEEGDVPPPRPPPPIKIERTVPTMIASEVPKLAASQWQIAAAPAPTPPPTPVAQPTDTAPITEARFDADYLKNPSPDYPALSRRMREQGIVVLRVRVREDGQPAEVIIEREIGRAHV